MNENLMPIWVTAGRMERRVFCGLSYYWWMNSQIIKQLTFAFYPALYLYRLLASFIMKVMFWQKGWMQCFIPHQVTQNWTGIYNIQELIKYSIDQYVTGSLNKENYNSHKQLLLQSSLSGFSEVCWNQYKAQQPCFVLRSKERSFGLLIRERISIP